MKKPKEIIKFVNEIKKKYKYQWEKEGNEIIQNIEQNKINKEEFKKILSILLITEDIPAHIFPNFWVTFSGAKEEMKKNKGQYKKLVKAFNILVKNKHPFFLYMERKMSIDLDRSFKYQKEKITKENINQLRDILKAFIVRDVSLNYCQGLNVIVAYFLYKTNYNEEESFYLFLRLMENILPYDYYLNGIGVEAELNILNILLEKYEPDLVKHLNKINGYMVVYTILTQFITSLLIFKTNENITNILFNCFFGFALLENKEDIFFYFYKVILSIFKILKNDLMKSKTMEQINNIVNLEKEMKKENIEIILYYTLFDESKYKLDIEYIRKLRKQEVNKIIENKTYKFNFQNNNNIECNINYPLCIEECNISSPPEMNVVYRSLDDINEEKNDDNINNINIINDDDVNEEKILKDIIIERRRHYCLIKQIKKKYNYHWEKEGQEIIKKMEEEEKINKEEIKNILSVLLLTENIPQDLLTKFWLSMSGANSIMKKNKGQYKKLVKAFNILIKNKHPFYLYLEKKASVDLKRSFNHKNKEIKEENINQLRDILYAFIVRNASINYCQGLNSIVGYLLEMTNFKEEESFYLFLNLIENILPIDYYLFAIGVEAELNILNRLLEIYIPKLYNHLNSIGAGPILFSTLTKFITSLLIFQTDRNITNFVFNCFFGFSLLENKEDRFLYFYKIILSIFKIYNDDLIKCKDMKEVNEIFKFDKPIKKEYIEGIIYNTLFDEFKKKFDVNLVKNLRKEEIDKIIKNKKAKFKFKNENNIKCNINYPICIEECNIYSPIELNIIYRSMNEKDENNFIDDDESEENILKNIIVERRKHYCEEKK